MNHLEELVGEWYEFNGYFVRRNVLVGKRPGGGFEGELDVVAFHPKSRHLVHIEPSLDGDSWNRREERFRKKFALGREHIPKFFSGMNLPNEITQIALFVFASKSNVTTIGGGQVALASELYFEIVNGLKGKRIASQAVPEQFPLLRTIQYCCEYESVLFPRSSTQVRTEEMTRFVPESNGP
jgi:hypothetical protein